MGGTMRISGRSDYRHRKIFFKWAFAEQRHAELFSGLLGDKPSTAEEFFRRLYITDIWKDAAFTKEPNYVQYWQSQLEKEISGISTEDVVFVGKPAHQYGKSAFRRANVIIGSRSQSRTLRLGYQLRRGLEEFHNACARDAKIAELKREIAELERKIKAGRG